MDEEELPQENEEKKMEVHHHSHTDRKKLKHYFFEFFMLFLAVVCGSLAEYYLEHTIERHREHEFIESMVEDLKEDTLKISRVVAVNNKQTKGLVQLSDILGTPLQQQDSVSKAYALYISSALNYDNVVFTDRTLTQLKNSGGLRLIRNQAVSDSIMSYDAAIKNCEVQFDVVKHAWDEQTPYSYQIFDFGNSFSQVKRTGANIPAVLAKMKLLTTDPAIITGYRSRITMYNAVIMGYSLAIKEQSGRAKKLIKFLKQQYKLEGWQSA